MANPAKYVWLDQGLKDAAQSGVPIVNAGLHYGFSVFEGIRCYATADGPAVFRLEEHVDRLLDSALIVGFRDLPWTRDSLIEAIYKTISANKFAACYIRPLIYLDGAMNLVVDSGRPRLIIAVWEWTASLFAPYPGFAADPYEEYSHPWFYTHRSVRGASVLTRPRMHHPRYRNFYMPERDDIFVGFRTCAL